MREPNTHTLPVHCAGGVGIPWFFHCDNLDVPGCILLFSHNMDIIKVFQLFSNRKGHLLDSDGFIKAPSVKALSNTQRWFVQADRFL